MISVQDEAATATPDVCEPSLEGRGGGGLLKGALPTARAARTEGARMLRFSGVGVINTVTDFAVFSAMTGAGIAPVAANFSGFLAANLQSYLLNSRITFAESGRAAPLSAIGYGKFLIVHGMSIVVSTILILLLSHRIGALPAKSAAIGLVLVWNYAASALFVFPRPATGTDEVSGERS